MALVKVIDEGRPLYGYRCPVCGRKVLHDAPIDVEEDKVCSNCGGVMVSTAIPKTRTREQESPSEPG